MFLIDEVAGASVKLADLDPRDMSPLLIELPSLTTPRMATLVDKAPMEVLKIGSTRTYYAQSFISVSPGLNWLFVLLISISSLPALASPVVSGQIIETPSTDWYQIQTASDFKSVCEGVSQCRVAPGLYIVINLSTGERWENIRVEEAASDDVQPPGIRVEGNRISWADDGWYQVQRLEDFNTICEGGRYCEVVPGSYVVINHSSGERWEDVLVDPVTEDQVGQVTDQPYVLGSTILWNSDGWYQVQSIGNYQSVCEGGSSCAVEPGQYVVINHDNDQRWELEVTGSEAEADDELPEAGGVSARPLVDGNRIYWTDAGWYQVQSAHDYRTLCEGQLECVVEPGDYIVINHSSGDRWDDIFVAPNNQGDHAEDGNDHVDTGDNGADAGNSDNTGEESQNDAVGDEPDSVQEGGTEPVFTRLDFRVVDAEYSDALDRLVLISANPDRLNIFDAVSGASQVVDLELVPLSVSVSPNGQTAVVGHDGWVSQVDLLNAELIKTVPVGTVVQDVVAGNSNLAYAFPDDGQWVNIHTVNLTTEIETESNTHPSIRHKTRVKLHPDGSKLYGADNGLSPSDIERYDLDSNGIAQRSYDSPYHGDYEMCGNLWLSEDGDRIFTACGNVFGSSDTPEEDMTYVGQLYGVERYEHIDHSLAAKQIVAIPDAGFGFSPSQSINDTSLFFYEDQFLQNSHTLDLPSYTSPVGEFSTHGKFVFYSADGTRFHTVVQVDEESGLLNDYAVWSAPLDTFDSNLVDQESETETSIPENPLDTALDRYGYNLAYRVIDAEYSLALDKLVLISTNPDRLHVVDGQTGETTSIFLNLTPYAVSVSPDGLSAVVGHDAWISSVDLQNLMLLDTFPVAANVGDIVYAGDDHAYIFPSTDQWVDIHSVNLTTGIQKVGEWSIYEGSRAKLYVDGLTIYTAEDDLSRFTLDSGVAEWAGSSYEASTCNDIWMSRDGHRVFTRCASVYRTSPVPTEDMSFNGSLSGIDRVQHLTHSEESGMVALLPAEDEYYIGDSTATHNQIHYYGYEYLNLLGIENIGSLESPTGSWQTEGRFVFFSRDGSRVFVIMQAQPDSGLLNDYAIWVTTPWDETIDRSDSATDTDTGDRNKSKNDIAPH